MFRATTITACLVLLLAFGSGRAAAQTPYPARTVTVVVPVSPGGTADALARVVAQQLQTTFGQPFVVDSRPGAGGNLGAEYVFKAAPDGYTLLCAPQGNFGVAHLLYKNLAFDPRALAPVSVLAKYPTVMLGRGDLPFNDIAGLIAYARANPGKLTYASQGNGQIGHLTFEMLKQMASVDLVHVPYRGSAPGIHDLLGGQVDVMADTLLASIAYIRSGQLKLLGVGSLARLAVFPDVPAVAEVLPGFESETWMAIAAPPATPKEITGKLSAAIAAIMHTPEAMARVSDLQAEAFGSTPTEMADLIRQSTARWEPVITSAKIKVE
ncbi:MAG: Bug family tripartite tricarboxylate transporter substrate binding protein [Xanthobacteraceae bacterium]